MLFAARPPEKSQRQGASVALILPACHEKETILPVLDELQSVLDPQQGWVIAVGVNGSAAGADQTAQMARGHALAPIVTETPQKGYGHGCQAAIDELERLGYAPDSFVFFAADGANDPRDLPALLAARQAGFDFVLGCRTMSWRNENIAVMGWSHVFANRLLGAWCGLLTRRWFRDIGPLRLIERGLFHRLRLREWTFGWTIEAQVVAGRLGAAMTEIPVRERPRLAGEQKVSKVNWRRTLSIGCKIALAGLRARCRRVAASRESAFGTPHAPPPPAARHAAEVA